MQEGNIISLSNNQEELDKDMELWLSLSYDERKRSDDLCINKYGCNNQELYNRIKASILSNTPITEALIGDIISTRDELIEKIKQSEQIQENDPNVIIIDDFVDVPYDLEIANTKYRNFYLLPENYRNISNSYSLSIYGKTIDDMYKYITDKIIGKIKVTNNEDYLLTLKKQEIEKSVDNGDFLEYCINKVDCLSGDKSLYESTVLESIIDNTPYKDFSYSKEMPSIVPFLTPYEFKHLTGNTIDPSSYICIENTTDYYNTIKKFQELLKESDQPEIYENAIIKMGWNPYIPIDGNSIKTARDRQIKWFNENKKINLIDLSNYEVSLEEEATTGVSGDKNRLEPVFLIFVRTSSTLGKIIRKVTNSMYSHAGISLDSSMNEIYSYNLNLKKKNNGFTIESLNDYIENKAEIIFVICMFVDKDVKEKIKKEINFYKENKDKTKYAIDNLFNILIHKKIEDREYPLRLVCSQFVDTILKMAGIDITTKNSNLVSPADLANSTRNDSINLYILFEGFISNYDKKKINAKIKKIIQVTDYENLNVIKAENAVKTLKIKEMNNLLSHCPDNNEINSILKEMREYVKPRPIYLQEQIDISSRYEDIHNIFANCGYSDIEKMKSNMVQLKNCMQKLEDEVSIKGNNEVYNDLRERMMNDYIIYMNIITVYDPSFVILPESSLDFKYDGNKLL